MKVKVATISDGEVGFSGILKVKSRDLEALAEMAEIPENQIRLKPKHIHMTAIHQSLLKPVKAEVKRLVGGGAIKVPDFDIIVEEVQRTSNCEKFGSRSSTVFKVTPPSQKKLSKWVEGLLRDLGVEDREDRGFHISISNLTGNPGDSVR